MNPEREKQYIEFWANADARRLIFMVNVDGKCGSSPEHRNPKQIDLLRKLWNQLSGNLGHVHFRNPFLLH